MHVAVIGAGAFGGWTALSLSQRGARVTLVDAWGPGNSRSSSGGETRIIRATYGSDLMSTRFAVRALALWKEYEERWKTRLWLRTGMVFLAGRNDDFVAASERALTQAGVRFELWSAAEAGRRYAHVNFEGIDSVLYEPDAGILTARENCRTVLKQFIAGGGTFQLASTARPEDLKELRLSDGSTLRADQYVFACGAWMGALFPDVLGGVIEPTRQDVIFLATPPGDASFEATQFPCWADRTSEETFYGIPDVQHRGFKVASDLRGPTFDPGGTDRFVNERSWRQAKAYVARRFPALKDAAVVETRVCPYENTRDLGFVIDRHPSAANVWLVGGGSGHGYKHGPAIGEYVTDLVYGTAELLPDFALTRFRDGAERRRSSI